ncbi:LysR family transcriptional regulator [Streptomyces antimicrobicus]|uniref:LysR family transcriptional regulator n=1 Tax=Streptomyces antimicrobicus TaxID=2883108 RepID=A0ABS8BF29_9ACTN|nr:LysR family transcriptional regulator [Streptomyces antimicrobicus]MCB5183245.1 LysR family transcriptional regulator [Streptomyces antimicrobicus]
MRISARVPDLPALDLLLSVIDLGSLGRAAQAHHITQPSASSRIRSLEQLVGTPVLQRTTLGSRPTPAGTLIAALAQDVIEAAQRLDAGISTLRDRRSAQMSVAASQTVGEYLFPRWLKDLRARTPGIAVTLDAGNSAEVAEAVLDGRFPIGFIESPHVPKGLADRAVAQDELLVVVAPRHPWARRTAITVEELACAELVQREPGSGARTAFERAVEAHVPDWKAAPLLELASTTAIKNAVMSGVGPAVMSSLAVADDLAAGTLTAVTVSGLRIPRRLRAVWPVGQRPVGAAQDLCAIACRPRP